MPSKLIFLVSKINKNRVLEGLGGFGGGPGAILALQSNLTRKNMAKGTSWTPPEDPKLTPTILLYVKKSS